MPLASYFTILRRSYIKTIFTIIILIGVVFVGIKDFVGYEFLLLTLSACLLILGGCCNTIVLILNKGKMPVLCDAAGNKKDEYTTLVHTDNDHILMTEDTRCNLLGDRFFVRYGPDSPHICSIGDIFVLIGQFVTAILFVCMIVMSLTQR